MIDLQGLIGRLSELLTDEGLDFWTKAYQAKSINEACRAIIKLKPEASYKRIPFACNDTALQQLPDDAFKLLDVEGVCDEHGHVLCAVKANSVAELNRQEPDWRGSEPTENIEFFLYEDLKPRQFWVYPRAAAGVRVSLVYSCFPPAIGKDDADLEMLPEYESDIVNHCLWKAYQREGKDSGAKAANARQVFHEELGLAIKADDATHPQDVRVRDERNSGSRH